MVKSKIKPLGIVKVVGKKDASGEEKPFTVGGRRERYYYVLADHAEQLKEINEAYKLKFKSGVKPLDTINVIGKRGLRCEERPFLVRGLKGWYYCVLAEHVEQLKEINSAYGKLLKANAKVEEVPIKEEVPVEEEIKEISEPVKERVSVEEKVTEPVVEPVKEEVPDREVEDAFRKLVRAKPKVKVPIVEKEKVTEPVVEPVKPVKEEVMVEEEIKEEIPKEEIGEEEVLSVLKHNPDGMRFMDIRDILGVNTDKLISIMNSLIKKDKIRSEGLKFFLK